VALKCPATRHTLSKPAGTTGRYRYLPRKEQLR
jgi:hypothetical protein